jgi:putative transposase
VYLHPHDSVSAARLGVARYFGFYNTRRSHRAHPGCALDVVYFAALSPKPQAA